METIELIFFGFSCAYLGSAIRGLIEAIYQKKEKQKQQAQFYIAKNFTKVGIGTVGATYIRDTMRNDKYCKLYSNHEILKEYLATKNNLSS